jgi:protein involved in ribonucleotide reduction
MKKILILILPSMSLIFSNNYFFSKLIMEKIKILFFLVVFTVGSFSMFAQNSSLISDCGDFISGPNSTWPYILVATTIGDGVVSQEAQTYTMNVTSLPADGANFRVYKTTANGNDYFGNPIALTIGSNSITVAGVAFDRAVKFQFSRGDVEFGALNLNGEDSDCVDPLPTPVLSLISYCGDFVSGPSAWPYVLVATTVADGALSQGAQTYTMNVTSLPADDANFRVYKTTANGNEYWADPIALTLGSNNITVAAVGFDRAVKFQFSSGDVEFDALSLNGEDSDCVETTSSVSIYSLDTQYGIQLFPNPTKNDLSISLEGIDVVDILIIDIQGKVLLQKSGLFDKDRIDLSGYIAGTYFFKIMIPEGSREIRVIKQ